MRLLYVDCDTLRADHLGCYGYHRKTSPNIDRIASEGVRFENCYATDAPCLPSRSAFFRARFGIHTGVVGHGGTAADPWIVGRERGFKMPLGWIGWVMCLSRAGWHTVSVSPFAERHSAWWFCGGWREFYNTGRSGHELAHEVAPYALKWLKENAKKDNWFLHVNFWDPHRPYRVPMEYGNPFESEPPPSWMTEEIIRKHRESFGPRSAREPHDWVGGGTRFEREPQEIASLDDYKKWIDGYDVGIKYMDDHIGMILDELERAGVLEETLIMVSADHGENQGELNVYGDHHTADQPTSRLPMILRVPGAEPRVDSALYYQLDFAPTLLELLGAKVPEGWDGESFAEAFRKGEEEGRDSLVVSQCVWSCQRSVRKGDWLLVRTYHDAYHDWPPVMLFDLKKDPHETTDLSSEETAVRDGLLAELERWTAGMMETSASGKDPMWTVIREGGPYHSRGWLRAYVERLKATGRGHHAEELLRRHPGEA